MTRDATASLFASRILMGTNDGRLIAIDAANRRRVHAMTFGDGGQVVIDVGMELLWPG